MAAEFVTSAAANTIGNLTTEYAAPYFSYFFRYGKIVEEFKNQQKELELKKDRVKHDVDEATRQIEAIENDVKEWVIMVGKELVEAHSLEAEIESKKCFKWCPSWGWRYCLSKKIAKKTVCIRKLLERCNFQRVGYRPPLQHIPHEHIMPFESSNLIFSEVINALNTNGVNMVGLYGMPGVGKTTLANKVGKHAKEEKMFDIVVNVVMSQTPDLNIIRNKIADSIGLQYKASSEDGKAVELWYRLRGVKILIIIDDVWNEFKLQKIGIPFGVEHKDCKILLTTRLQSVCVQMNCPEKIQLGVLSKEEAWALFKDKADLKDVSSTMNDVAKEVAFGCKGLPLAIVTVAMALKGASLDEWRAANQRFKDSRHLDNEDVCGSIYKCLELSYYNLNGDNIQSCFLLCSLFPEDSDIGIESLVMLGVGYELFSNVHYLEELRIEIFAALTKLQKSGLLLGNERNVRIHHVIRDFAHWKTLREKNIFMVKEGLEEWPRESFECCTSISFWNNNIKNFPENLEFLELRIFVFEGINLVEIPSAFVEGMKELRALCLKKVVFSIKVLKFLTRLRTLCFEDCKLENISSLRNIENLEILALYDTNIYELPEELVALRGLKSLHFSCSGKRNFSCFKKSNFRPNLLSRLTSLQELHMTCINVNSIDLNSLSGLTSLSLGVSIDQYCPENFVFPKLKRYIIVVNRYLYIKERASFRTLTIGDFSSSFSAFKELFCNVEKLILEKVKEHKNIVPSIDQKGLNELTSLELRYCEDMKCLMDATGEKGPTLAFSNLVKLHIESMTCLKELCRGQPSIRFLQKLKDVYIEDCKELKVAFPMNIGHLEKEEISQTLLLSNLTRLVLRSLPELESIWKLQPSHASLRSVKVVSIQNCKKLKSIFSTSLAQSLLHLQQLNISYCGELENVFDFTQEMAEHEVPALSNLTSLELMSLLKLRCIWKGPTHLVNLQSLKTMIIRRCFELENLFTMALAESLVHLEVLQICDCDSLEHLIIEEEKTVDEIVSNIDDSFVCWPKLRSLKIIDCGSLNHVFSITLAPQLTDSFLQNLNDVIIRNCKRMKVVFQIDGKEEEVSAATPLLSNLANLILESLPELENIWTLQPIHQYYACLQSLKVVTIRRCNKLKSIFSTCLAQSLSCLQQLYISGCYELQQVFDFHQQMAELQENQVPPLSNLTSLELDSLLELKWIWEGRTTHLVNLQNLKTMKITRYLRLAYLFSIPIAQSLVHLEVLDIQYCDTLEHVIIEEAKNEDEILLVSNVDGYNSLCWPKLKTLWIKGCESLKYVFPMILAQGLLNLEFVKISDCSQLKQVFNILTIENGSGRHRQLDNILLQRLQTLQLENLENLSSFCPRNFVMSSPSLKEFKVGNCPRLSTEQLVTTLQVDLKELTSLTLKDGKDLHCLIDTTEDHQGRVSTGSAFYNLVELVIQNMSGFKMLCNGRFPKGFLRKLEMLETRNCMELASLSPMLQNLKIVRVTNCGHLQEVFQIDDNELLHHDIE